MSSAVAQMNVKSTNSSDTTDYYTLTWVHGDGTHYVAINLTTVRCAER